MTRGSDQGIPVMTCNMNLAPVGDFGPSKALSRLSRMETFVPHPPPVPFSMQHPSPSFAPQANYIVHWIQLLGHCACTCMCHTVFAPSRIGLYPVHLHRLPMEQGHGYRAAVDGGQNLPSKASSMSCSLGVGLFRRSAYSDMTMPGVQNPHCDPCILAIRSYAGTT